MKKYLIVILFLMSCGTQDEFPLILKMDCDSQIYGIITNTDVNVFGKTISVKVNDDTAFLVAREAVYVEPLIVGVVREMKDYWAHTSLTEYRDGRIVLIASGIVCNGKSK